MHKSFNGQYLGISFSFIGEFIFITFTISLLQRLISGDRIRIMFNTGNDDVFDFVLTSKKLKTYDTFQTIPFMLTKKGIQVFSKYTVKKIRIEGSYFKLFEFITFDKNIQYKVPDDGADLVRNLILQLAKTVFSYRHIYNISINNTLILSKTTDKLYYDSGVN